MTRLKRSLHSNVDLLPRYGVANIKDFGAKGDGVTNDLAAFVAFNTWARTQTTAVTLCIPPGTYAGITGLFGSGTDFFVGIKDLTIYAYGATINNMRGGSGFEVNFVTPITVWGQIQTVQSASTSVTLLTLSDASKFAAGNWAAVTSLETQGNGFPPNWYYVDYVQISTVNASTGVITFVDPINYTHKSTYPDTSVPPGSNFHGFPGSAGGPASLFLLHPDWDATIKIYGLTVIGGSQEIFLGARRVRCIDCTFGNNVGFSATATMFSTFENCYFPNGIIEVDKDISHLKFVNCRIHSISLQSSSDDIVFDGCHIGTLAGNSRRIRLRDTCIAANWNLSAPPIGANLRLTIENCHIANLTAITNNNIVLLSSFTFSNGTFSIPLSAANVANVYRMAIPGSKMFISSSNSFINLGAPFIVTNVYQDATNLYFDTTLATLPTFTGTFTVNQSLCQHSCPSLIASNVTGNDTAIMLGKQAKELPIFSYAHKVYSADLSNVNPGSPGGAQQIYQWGTLVSLKVNVIQADTGANGTLTLHPIGKFGANTMNASNAYFQFDLTINLKTAGVRTVTPTNVTGNVTGDVISAPGAVWFIQWGLAPWISASIAANTPAQMPIVEIELVTDQGVTALEYTVQ